jgi:hypothetical protein
MEKGIYVIHPSSDPNAIASLLKLWLRELPDPIIPKEFYDACLTNASNDDWQASCNVCFCLSRYLIKLDCFPSPSHKPAGHRAPHRISSAVARPRGHQENENDIGELIYGIRTQFLALFRRRPSFVSQSTEATTAICNALASALPMCN